MIAEGYTISNLRRQDEGLHHSLLCHPHGGTCMRHAVIGYVVRTLLILLVFASAASPQTAATAQMNGTVRDQAGLSLPGVTVTVTHTDTGLTPTAVTDVTG